MNRLRTHHIVTAVVALIVAFALAAIFYLW